MQTANCGLSPIKKKKLKSKKTTKKMRQLFAILVYLLYEI